MSFATATARHACLLALLLALMPLRAAAKPAADGLSLAEMESQLEIYKSAAADNPDSARLAEIYRSAVANLKNAQQNRDAQADFERVFAEAPARTRAATAELKDIQRQARSAQGLEQGVGVERLERLLRDNRARLEVLRERESALQEQTATLGRRATAAREELKAAAANEGLREPLPRSGEGPAFAQARSVEWRAREALRGSLQARLETEIRTLPERLAAAQAELKLTGAQREQTERFLDELLGLDTVKRIAEAEQMRAEMARRLERVSSTHPEIATLAADIRALSAEYVDLVTRAESIAADLTEASNGERELSASYQSIKQQLELAALNDALGPLLMEHYQQLDAVERSGERRRNVARQLADARLRDFQVGELLGAEGQLRERVYRAIEAGRAGDAGGADAAERAVAMAESDRLLNDRYAVLDALNRTYLRTIDQFVELDSTYRQQADVARKFRKLLDRNLIWMPSHRPLRGDDLLSWGPEVWTQLVRQDWVALLRGIAGAMVVNPLGNVALLLAVCVLTVLQRRMRGRIVRHSLRSVGWASYRYRHAIEAIVVHLLLAAPLPLALLWFGWAGQQANGAGQLAAAVSRACFATAPLAYAYLLLMEMHASYGFARQHLRYKAARVKAVALGMRSGIAVVLPLQLLAALAAALPAAGTDDTLPRVTGIVTTLAFLAFTVHVTRVGAGMFNTAFFSRRHPRIGRAARALMLMLVVLLPLIVVLECLGYHFTARALMQCAMSSFALLLLAKIAFDTGLLGITLAAHRSMSLHQERTEGAEGEAGGEPQEAGRTGDIVDDIDWDRMNASALVLLQASVGVALALLLFSVWSQFFTALEVLDSVALWHYEVRVDGQDTLATVSLFGLGQALCVLVLSLVLAKGLPALVGIIGLGFLQERGLLFAIQRVIEYGLITLGVFFTLQTLGFGWSKLQWMAAGLSVGLGFGLQEVFANFFSGLIMLFERPVRIGDVVTLGEFSGSVQRIRMRATTLLDSQNREVIVPNKNFVTERLINWTLSSPAVRLSFDVGISITSDPRHARELLLEVLEADPRVFRDPAPAVIFREFGANALVLACSCQVADLQQRNLVQNDLHMRIYEVFGEHGIELAVPPLDRQGRGRA